MGQDFAFGKLAHRSPQLLLFIRQRKFHVTSPVCKINDKQDKYRTRTSIYITAVCARDNRECGDYGRVNATTSSVCFSSVTLAWPPAAITRNCLPPGRTW